MDCCCSHQTTVRADTIRLKSGAILVGDVAVSDNGDLVVTTRFPEEATLTLKRDELTHALPSTMSSTGGPAPKTRMPGWRLGELAESAGLFGMAVSDYLAVAQLRPDLRKDMERRVERVREAIAAEILSDARELLEQGQTQTEPSCISTRFKSDTERREAAKEAKKLMATGHEHAGESAEVGKKTVSGGEGPQR